MLFVSYCRDKIRQKVVGAAGIPLSGLLIFMIIPAIGIPDYPQAIPALAVTLLLTSNIVACMRAIISLSRQRPVKKVLREGLCEI